MTRINCIPPEELHSKHLVAEYRELPRVFGLVIAAQLRGETPDDKRNPKVYTLGTGHVRFFYDKLAYLEARFDSLVLEMINRGHKPAYLRTPKPRQMGIADIWCNNWTPTPEAQAINRERIAARMPK